MAPARRPPRLVRRRDRRRARSPYQLSGVGHEALSVGDLHQENRMIRNPRRARSGGEPRIVRRWPRRCRRRASPATSWSAVRNNRTPFWCFPPVPEQKAPVLAQHSRRRLIYRGRPVTRQVAATGAAGRDAGRGTALHQHRAQFARLRRVSGAGKADRRTLADFPVPIRFPSTSGWRNSWANWLERGATRGWVVWKQMQSDEFRARWISRPRARHKALSPKILRGNSL